MTNEELADLLDACAEGGAVSRDEVAFYRNLFRDLITEVAND